MVETRAGRTVGSVGGREHLDGDDAMQPFVETLEHDAEAAAADDFLDLIMPQPAEMRRVGRRRQE